MPFQILQSQFPLTSHQFKRTRSPLQAVSKICLLSASISFLLFSTFLSWKLWTRIGEVVSPHKVPFVFKLAWRVCSLSRLPSQPSLSQLLNYWLWMIIKPNWVKSTQLPYPTVSNLCLGFKKRTQHFFFFIKLSNAASAVGYWLPIHHRANTHTHLYLWTIKCLLFTYHVCLLVWVSLVSPTIQTWRTWKLWYGWWYLLAVRWHCYSLSDCANVIPVCSCKTSLVLLVDYWSRLKSKLNPKSPRHCVLLIWLRSLIQCKSTQKSENVWVTSLPNMWLEFYS